MLDLREKDVFVQVKVFEGFDMVGESFVVAKITDDTIHFEHLGGKGYGYMSYSEYYKYFKKVDTQPQSKQSQPKPVWLPIEDLLGIDKVDNPKVKIAYRVNGKKTYVKVNDCVGASSCNPNDIYDLDIGLTYAYIRANNKYLVHKDMEIDRQLRTAYNTLKTCNRQIERLNARKEEICNKIEKGYELLELHNLLSMLESLGK